MVLVGAQSFLQYLACQGFAIQGHTFEKSNLIHLLNVCAQADPVLKSQLARRQSKVTFS